MLSRLFAILALIFAISAPAAAQTDDCLRERWFCTDELNAALGPVPEELDRTTPHATLETFVRLSAARDWRSAAHLLDLSGLDVENQAILGPLLAEQLSTVLDRKTVIDWNTITVRPDGLNERENADAPMAGEPRKSLRLWMLDLSTHSASIRLSRVKSGDGEPVWIFSTQTVDDIPALAERYGPSRFELMLPESLREKVGFGLMGWELIGLPLVLILAALIGRLAWKALDAASGRFGAQMTGEILRAIRGPVTVGLATGFAFFVGADAFVFSGLINTVFTPLAWLGVVGSALWLFVNAVEVVLDRVTRFEDTDITQGEAIHARTVATRIAAARRAFLIAVVLIGGGMFLSQTTLFENLGLTLLGTAGALTLVLGFAARRVLGNIMASLQIALNGSAKIGDRIVYKDYLCHVERINFTYVQLRDWDGTRLIVPVEEFVSTDFENWTMKEPAMLRIIKLKFAHQADVEQLRKIFDEIIPELDQDLLGDLDAVKVRVAEQDVFGKDVWFALPCSDPNSSWDMACLAREKIIAAAERIGRENNVAMFPEANPAEAA
ncbi:mechanosensitive ion channel [Alphaproteobacteria bacterium GH1-50]|uniref:Mechanosensitive ion channel n=1 Tax=Kangsaoukella pontilimi TaxID=2691042 RepID=A0A7C9MJX9_9RHOB|nr:mechanosensitive ion channel domain-containing protein [Kangsaoukella pontilimi]MXQ08115.1 mechanosensitive ion channel [Kangsaoukella pontilimi]